MINAFCKRQNKALGCTFLCAKDQFTVYISQFTFNVYVRPDKVEIYMQFKKTVQNAVLRAILF